MKIEVAFYGRLGAWVFGIWYLVFGIRYSVFGIWYLVFVILEPQAIESQS